jgi:hypothetical protein
MNPLLSSTIEFESFIESRLKNDISKTQNGKSQQKSNSNKIEQNANEMLEIRANRIQQNYSTKIHIQEKKPILENTQKIELVHSWRKHVYNDRNLNNLNLNVSETNDNKNKIHKTNKVLIKMAMQTLDSTFQNQTKKDDFLYLNQNQANKSLQQQDVKIRMVLLSRLLSDWKKVTILSITLNNKKTKIVKNFIMKQKFEFVFDTLKMFYKANRFYKVLLLFLLLL